jgi:hypothetical protein
MTRHVVRKFQTLSVVTLFVATVTILTTWPSAHAENAGQTPGDSPVASTPERAITPNQAVKPPGADNLQRVSGNPARKKKFGAIPMDSGNPLFRPAVSYFAGGAYPDYAEWSLAVADLNGDGKPDLVVINFNGAGNSWDATHGGFGVMLGNGDGTFQPVQMTYLSQGTSYLAIGDINGDGKPDLVIASCCESNGNGIVAVLLGNGDGTFQAPVNYDAGGGAGGVGQPLALTDLNGDGKLDIVAVNWGGSVGVLLGNGDGTFKPAVIYQTGANASSLALADLNRDGKIDAVVQSFDGGSVAVLLGNGDGTFQPDSVYNLFNSCEGQSMTVADVNGDGIPDLAIAGPSPSACGAEGFIGVSLGNGDGSFQPMAFYDAGGLQPTSVEIRDVNGDGKPDLLVANVCGTVPGCGGADDGTVGILLGNGDGTFQPQATFATAGSSGTAVGSLAVADLNGDGRPDLVVANIVENTVGVLLNANPTTTTLGSSTNPSVFGQFVTFTATVSPASGTATGTVVFYDLSTELGSATLANGSASISVSSLVAGSHSITAAYQGAGAFVPSTSTVLNQAVNRASTVTSLLSSANPAKVKQIVTYTATVTSQYGGAASGTMTFQDGGATVGSVMLSGNQAAYHTSYSTKGVHSITATYSGDANNGGSPSPVLTEEVGKVPYPSETTLATSGSPSLVGQPVTFTATVTSTDGTIPNGELVTFYDGTVEIGTGTTASGLATFTTSSLAAKKHTIKAVYAGDGTFKTSGGKVMQVVDQ